MKNIINKVIKFIINTDLKLENLDRKTLIITLLILLLLLFLNSRIQTCSRKKRMENAIKDSIFETSLKLKSTNIYKTLRFRGITKCKSKAKILSPVSGIIEIIKTRENTKVSKYQTLVIIATDNNKKVRVKAPVSGTAAEIRMNKNLKIKAGRYLMKIVDKKSVTSSFFVDEKTASSINISDEAILFYSHPRRWAFKSIINSISNVFGDRYKVTVSINNKNEIISQNAHININLTVVQYTNIIQIPSYCTFNENEKDYVFIYDIDKKEMIKREIIITMIKDNNIIIGEGLKVGEYLVTENKKNPAYTIDELTDKTLKYRTLKSKYKKDSEI